MHKTRIRFIALTVLLCLAPGGAFADGKWSLKLQGGWAYISGGDVNPGTQGFYDWGKTYFAPPEGGVIEGDFSPLHQGFEIGGDIIFQLTPAVGIGIGAGYLRMSSKYFDSLMRINHDPANIGLVYDFNEATTLEAVPVRLSLFWSLPVIRKVDVTANAGLSYYVGARYRADWLALQFDMTGSHPFQKFLTTAGKERFPLGLHGSLGIEYRMLRNLGIFVEARGRYARFRGLEGTTASEAGELGGGLLPEFTENGTLFYDLTPNLPGEPRLIMVQSRPDGALHRAVVDFSGLSLQTGFRIRL